MFFRRRSSRKSYCSRRNRPGSLPSFRRLEQLEDRRLLTFAAPVDVPLANIPQCFALGDFNDDGKVDMAVAVGGYGSTPYQIDVFNGKGDGTFQPPVVAYTAGSDDAITSVAATDLNHDGKFDLVAIVGRKLDVFLSNGDGTFQSPMVYNVDVSTSLALGDVTGDGQTDVVLAGDVNYETYTIQVLRGNDDGTLQSPITSTLGQFYTPQNYTFEPTSLALGDFSGNGKLDIVAADLNDQRVLVSRGNGDGTFQAPVSYTTDAIPQQDTEYDILGRGTTAVAVGDFRHDGKLDIAAANYGAGTVSVLMGNGDGTFRAAVNYAVGGQPRDVAVGNFDNDGNLDLAVTAPLSNAVFVLDGNGDGTFQTPTKAADINGPQSLAVGDFNNDGLADVATTDTVWLPGAVSNGYGVSAILSNGAPHQSEANTPNQSFLAQIYQQLLGRAIDPTALAYWNSYLQNGGSRLQLARTIEASVEYLSDQVQALYQRYLQRNADPAGLDFFVQFLGTGGTLEEVAAAMLGSAEFSDNLAPQSGQTTDSAFVDALFPAVLGRAASTADVTYFDSLLAQGATRADVALLVLTSSEHRGQLAQDWYQTSLGRDADPGAIQFVTQALDDGQTDQQVLAAVVSSDEYFRDSGA